MYVGCRGTPLLSNQDLLYYFCSVFVKYLMAKKSLAKSLSTNDLKEVRAKGQRKKTAKIVLNPSFPPPKHLERRTVRRLMSQGCTFMCGLYI